MKPPLNGRLLLRRSSTLRARTCKSQKNGRGPLSSAHGVRLTAKPCISWLETACCLGQAIEGPGRHAKISEMAGLKRLTHQPLRFLGTARQNGGTSIWSMDVSTSVGTVAAEPISSGWNPNQRRAYFLASKAPLQVPRDANPGDGR